MVSTKVLSILYIVCGVLACLLGTVGFWFNMTAVYNGGVVPKSDWNGVFALLTVGAFVGFTGYKLCTLVDYENGVN